jgi:lysyl-tRNA synthetase class 2
MAKQRLEEIRKIRLEKVKKLREQGIDPYPSKVDGEPKPIKDALVSEGKEVELAGRIVGWRSHGNTTFADLKDESGQIQLWFQKDKLSDKYEILKYFDIGDFIYIKGKVTKTKAGEITVDVSKFQLLTKSIRPLPSTFHGLKDVEERYRQRYVDLLLNPAVKEIFEKRSQVVSLLRKYLDEYGFLEVTTPALQPLYGGATAKPFVTHHNALDIDLYLRIADELYLKRLIVGGFEKVYEICTDFRNEGIDRWHNPEFSMLEFYWAYADYNDLMELTENMLSMIAKEITGSYEVKYGEDLIDFKPPWKRVGFRDVILEKTGIDIEKPKTLEELLKLTKEKGVSFKAKDVSDFPTALDALYKKEVRPKLINPIFVIDHPYSMRPLAKKKEKDPTKVESIQPIVAGAELLNAYSELNDPVDQRVRWEEDIKRAKRGAEEYQVIDEDYIRALEYGMPPTAGWGMGIDRFVAILTNRHSIKDTILFPTLRPEGNHSQDAKADIAAQVRPVPDELRNFGKISSDLKQAFPGISFAFTVIENVEIKKKDQELENLKKTVLKKQENISLEQIQNIESIKVYREMLKKTGVKTSTRRPSPEALLRRIVQGKGLYTINTAVDAYNIAVLETNIGLGGFDFEKITQPVTLRFSKDGEEMILLGESEVTKTKKAEIVYADKEKLLTLDLNYRDIDKTKITLNTKSVMLFADGGPGIEPDKVRSALELGAKYIQKFCGGEIKDIVLVNGAPVNVKFPKDDGDKEVENLGIDYKKAKELLEEYVSDEITRLHSVESEAIMRALARHFSEDEEKWGIIGLLHDIDWDLTKNDTKKHGIKTAEILKKAGGTDFLIETIQSHGYSQGWGDDKFYGPEEFKDKKRTTRIQYALAAAETLTGLIIATALIQPDKKLKSVKLSSLKKKYNNKKFAANCNREIIKECEQVGLSLDQFLEIGLKALQELSDELGL